MYRLIMLGLGLAVISLTSGCASMVKTFPIDSQPAGAAVSLDGKPTGGITPCIFRVKDFEPGKHVISVSKTGYITQTPPLEFNVKQNVAAGVCVSILAFPSVLLAPAAIGIWANDCKTIKSANRPVWPKFAKPFILQPCEVAGQIGSDSSPVVKRTTDSIHLKDGSIIRGQLVEIQPGKHYKLQRSDGSIQVYSTDLVESVER